MIKKKLAIITTHPVQYNAPLFKLLHERGIIDIKVFYTWGEKVLTNKYDPGFDKNIIWDIPLMDGYAYEFVVNIAKHPGSHHYRGINNPDLIDTIKKWQADAILVYGWAFKSHLKAMRYFHNKIPVFFRGDSNLLNKRNIFKNTLRTIFLKWVYSHVDKAVYVGTKNKEYYLCYGLKQDQLVFGPHAVDNNRFEDNENFSEEVLKWKANLNMNVSATGFLYAGKLDDNKNVRLLLKAFSAVKGECYLIIAGNGVLENEFKTAYSGHNNIYFLPFQNQAKMPILYRLADVFVLPSKSETWGLGINESMACERVLLVSNGCGAAFDLIKEGVNGFTFKFGDEADLREKIITLIDKKNNLKEMGKSSFNIIQNWNYEKDCVAIESLFI